MDILKPTGPENMLKELDQEISDGDNIEPADESQFTPCDCGECPDCLLDEICENTERCPECGRLDRHCNCDATDWEVDEEADEDEEDE